MADRTTPRPFCSEGGRPHDPTRGSFALRSTRPAGPAGSTGARPRGPTLEVSLPMTQTPTTPAPNDSVVFQNAYSPYVAVAVPGADGRITPSELLDRIRIQGRLAEGQVGAAGQVNYILVIDVSASMGEDGKLMGAIAGAIEGLHAVRETAGVGVVACLGCTYGRASPVCA